jgi:hypothetical protein
MGRASELREKVLRSKNNFVKRSRNFGEGDTPASISFDDLTTVEGNIVDAGENFDFSRLSFGLGSLMERCSRNFELMVVVIVVERRENIRTGIKSHGV